MLQIASIALYRSLNELRMYEVARRTGFTDGDRRDRMFRVSRALRMRPEEIHGACAAMEWWKGEPAFTSSKRVVGRVDDRFLLHFKDPERWELYLRGWVFAIGGIVESVSYSGALPSQTAAAHSVTAYPLRRDDVKSAFPLERNSLHCGFSFIAELHGSLAEHQLNELVWSPHLLFALILDSGIELKAQLGAPPVESRSLV